MFSVPAIAIDYDDTYTTAPEMWDQIIGIMLMRGFRVICVTCRRDTDKNRDEVVVNGIPVFFTGLSPKKWFMREKRGVKVDIWIDDMPRSILEGR